MSKLWGSRFKKSTSALADHFSFSIPYDYRLALYDILGSIAHARMLGKTNIISHKDARLIVAGLKKLGKKIEKGQFKFDAKAEDVHTNIQAELKKIIGKAADKLHSARSRNDLIVLDMKMYSMVESNAIIDLISELQKAMLKFAEKFKDVIIPAYTHLQSAQAVLLSHHILAYVEMLERDKGRLKDCIVRTDSMPLGSCALSGTTLPIDRNYVTDQLGFIEPTQNSIDSVSDRDFLIEAISSLAIMAMHFSRIAEDFIIWSSQEFNLLNIDWSLCTGSSIMPHKKNPDILELIRGETATIYGNLHQLLVLTKGLPLTYNRDLQLDKPSYFSSVEKSQEMIKLLTALFKSLKINKESAKQRLYDESFYTVDIMEYLIKKGVAYREAHDIVGKMVKECLDEGKKIGELEITQLKRYSPLFEGDVKNLLNPEMSVKMKKSFGSTNPSMVKQQINKWKRKLK